MHLCRPIHRQASAVGPQRVCRMPIDVSFASFLQLLLNCNRHCAMPKSFARNLLTLLLSMKLMKNYATPSYEEGSAYAFNIVRVYSISIAEH